MRLQPSKGPWRVLWADLIRAHPDIAATDGRILARTVNSEAVPAPESDDNARILAGAWDMYDTLYILAEAMDEAYKSRKTWSPSTARIFKEMSEHIRACLATIEPDAPAVGDPAQYKPPERFI